MGRAILEMQDLYIAVELPDDVVREFILEALGGKLGLPLGTYYYNILKKVAAKLGIQLPQAPSGRTPALNTSKRVASLEDAILEILQESKNGLKVRQVAKKLWKRGFNVSLAKVRNTLQKLIKEDKVKADKSFARAYRYFISDNGAAKTFSEEDILRAFYLEKQKIEDIAEQFDITPEQVVEIVTSEKGKLYAKVNTDLDTEKLQETLKKEVELMKELTKDAAVEGTE